MAIRREYETGASIRALSQKLGLSFGTVRALLVEAGARLRGQSGATPAAGEVPAGTRGVRLNRAEGVGWNWLTHGLDTALGTGGS